MHNFSHITQHFMEWSMQGYVTVFGYFIWPIIFSAVIGYIYIKNASAISAGVAIVIIFTCFALTSWIANIPNLVILFQLIFALSITGLIMYFVSRRRG